MAIRTRRPRRINPVHGTVRLEVEPGYPVCDVNEIMLTGTVVINGQGYAIRPIAGMVEGNVAVIGYRLVKHAAQIVVYDVNCEGNDCSCDCPDFTFTRDGKDPRGCKHILSIKALRERGTLR